ncbi:hypothetical protein UFOVP941_36 [uncultured Caudovirales phage]|uniref:Uncharacterized protein n=1 Tax=uncultured Caudovirales phage TaxID=2100421 RepID=A0A6J5Q033_9CAUD|nr:hypothetical protein UFOVP941_36 [uncultured Caudovirales phage]CAB4202652.1 hypothetical protein UFOVP1373_31 [uncultured Caudovirales phage]
MKTIFLILFSSCCYAQQYDAESLNTMNKLELSKIYLDKLNQVSKLLPMMAFTIKFEGELDTYDGVIEIPNTKQNKSALDRVTLENNNNADVSRDNLKVLIPYADKQKIIESIIRFEKIIDMMKSVKE